MAYCDHFYSLLVLPPDIFFECSQTIDETEHTDKCSVKQHLCVKAQPSKVDADLLSIIFPMETKTIFTQYLHI